jgi:hypothetical protein
MNHKELKSIYKRRLTVTMRILYDLDPEGMGRTAETPPDEYSDAAAWLVSRLWRAKSESEASQLIRYCFPAAEKSLIDALWAAQQDLA